MTADTAVSTARVWPIAPSFLRDVAPVVVPWVACPLPRKAYIPSTGLPCPWHCDEALANEQGTERQVLRAPRPGSGRSAGTHTNVRVGAVLDQSGRLLATSSFPATTRGYAQLAT